MRNSLWLFGIFVVGLSGCGGGTGSVSTTHTATLTKEEVVEDLETMASQFRRLYGPLEFKESRFGWTLDGLVAKAKGEIAAARTDLEYQAVLKRFIGAFEDGHVGIRFPGNASNVRSYSLGVFVAPLEGRAIVASVAPEAEAFGLAPGDELVEIDGVTPMSLLPVIKQYEAYANDLSDEHTVEMVTARPAYLTELTPTQPSARLKITRPNGQTFVVDLPWRTNRYSLADVTLPGPSGSIRGPEFVVTGAADHNELARGTFEEFGAARPFFATAAVKARFGMTEVDINDDYLKKYNVKREDLQEGGKSFIYSALYRHQGRTVMVLRIPTYSPDLDTDKLVRGYKAVLDQYQSLVDVLVIDQTNNPGGSMGYLHELFAIFVRGQAANMVQAMNVDRKWIYGMMSWADEYAAIGDATAASLMRQRAKLIDLASDAGLSMTAPMPIVGVEYVYRAKDFTWEKPVLVLTNELAGSCGDIFPMLMQSNRIARLFGERTMGLGGNVEKVVTLPNSQAMVRLTRGLFTTYREDGIYADSVWVENNGVTPDIRHQLSRADFLNGWTDYVQAFSDAAVAQLGQP